MVRACGAQAAPGCVAALANTPYELRAAPCQEPPGHRKPHEPSIAGPSYTAEYGWHDGFERHVVRLVAALAEPADPARQRGWIAELDGRRVGSIACTPSKEGPDVAQLRLLLLHPDARGLGLGGRLVDTCIAFGTGAGYRRMRLWTTDVLTAARALYEKRGFRVVASAPHHGFGPELVGLDYERDLASP